MATADDGFEVELCAIEITNLRGFRDARLTLHEGLALLVGPNNSGKTSILRILDWVVNRANEAVLTGAQQLSAAEYDLLVPARNTRGGARRITLDVRITDGRRARRFFAHENVARLRIGVSAGGDVRLNVGAPKRREAAETGAALDLLLAVRRCTEFGLVPASRDASSETFQVALHDAIVARLEERAIHARRAGAPAEYRDVRKALSQLEEIGRALVAPLWEQMKATLPPGLAEAGELKVSISPEDFVPWLAQRVALRLVTGTHDAESVAAVEVGSGLQSLLELATQRAAASQTGEHRILAIEEPEAFLHPAAQRTLARQLAETLGGKRIVSTHSPLVVEEAKYGDVVLVRKHRFFEPAPLEDEAKRSAINTALLTGFGAEMAFARSVLLVEGDGDRLFFEGLRRRVARSNNEGCVDEVYVVPTGSKTAYGPWLNLLSSYGREGDRPVSWLAAPDSDAATDIRRAWNDAGISLPAQVVSALSALSQVPGDDEDGIATAVDEANAAARTAQVGIEFLSPDLEGAMLSDCKPKTVARICDRVGAPESDRATLTAWLRKSGNKAPWIRAAIADEIPWGELSPSALGVLRRWLESVTDGLTVSRLLRETR
jgi:energy-coupling factor transporter ATP-binding protein EcfA2